MFSMKYVCPVTAVALHVMVERFVDFEDFHIPKKRSVRGFAFQCLRFHSVERSSIVSMNTASPAPMVRDLSLLHRDAVGLLVHGLAQQ